MVKNKAKPDCLEATLQIMGDKWTALIVRELTSRPAKFSSLEVSLVGISPRTLSQRLDMLVTEKIIDKQIYCQRPPRFTYQLTPKGQELQAILAKMSSWGARHGCQTT